VPLDFWRNFHCFDSADLTLHRKPARFIPR